MSFFKNLSKRLLKVYSCSFGSRYSRLSPTSGVIQVFSVSSNMDKAALVRTLVMSEKNHSKVTIKTISDDKPVVGAVQKVLNQIIILKSATSTAITITFADIVSVTLSADSFLDRLSSFFRKI